MDNTALLKQLIKGLKYKGYAIGTGPKFAEGHTFKVNGKVIVKTHPKGYVDIYEDWESGLDPSGSPFIAEISLKDLGVRKSVYFEDFKYIEHFVNTLIKDIKEILSPSSLKFIKDIEKKGKTDYVKYLKQELSKKYDLKISQGRFNNIHIFRFKYNNTPVLLNIRPDTVEFWYGLTPHHTASVRLSDGLIRLSLGNSPIEKLIEEVSDILKPSSVRFIKDIEKKGDIELKDPLLQRVYNWLKKENFKVEVKYGFSNAPYLSLTHWRKPEEDIGEYDKTITIGNNDNLANNPDKTWGVYITVEDVGIVAQVGKDIKTMTAFKSSAIEKFLKKLFKGIKEVLPPPSVRFIKDLEKKGKALDKAEYIRKLLYDKLKKYGIRESFDVWEGDFEYDGFTYFAVVSDDARILKIEVEVTDKDGGDLGEEALAKVVLEGPSISFYRLDPSYYYPKQVCEPDYNKLKKFVLSLVDYLSKELRPSSIKLIEEMGKKSKTDYLEYLKQELSKKYDLDSGRHILGGYISLKYNKAIVVLTIKPDKVQFWYGGNYIASVRLGDGEIVDFWGSHAIDKLIEEVSDLLKPLSVKFIKETSKDPLLKLIHDGLKKKAYRVEQLEHYLSVEISDEEIEKIGIYSSSGVPYLYLFGYGKIAWVSEKDKEIAFDFKDNAALKKLTKDIQEIMQPSSVKFIKEESEKGITGLIFFLSEELKKKYKIIKKTPFGFSIDSKIPIKVLFTATKRVWFYQEGTLPVSLTLEDLEISTPLNQIVEPDLKRVIKDVLKILQPSSIRFIEEMGKKGKIEDPAEKLRDLIFENLKKKKYSDEFFLGDWVDDGFHIAYKGEDYYLIVDGLAEHLFIDFDFVDEERWPIALETLVDVRLDTLQPSFKKIDMSKHRVKANKPDYAFVKKLVFDVINIIKPSSVKFIEEIGKKGTHDEAKKTMDIVSKGLEKKYKIIKKSPYEISLEHKKDSIYLSVSLNGHIIYMEPKNYPQILIHLKDLYVSSSGEKISPFLREVVDDILDLYRPSSVRFIKETKENPFFERLYNGLKKKGYTFIGLVDWGVWVKDHLGDFISIMEENNDLVVFHPEIGNVAYISSTGINTTSRLRYLTLKQAEFIKDLAKNVEEIRNTPSSVKFIKEESKKFTDPVLQELFKGLKSKKYSIEEGRQVPENILIKFDDLEGFPTHLRITYHDGVIISHDSYSNMFTIKDGKISTRYPKEEWKKYFSEKFIKGLLEDIKEVLLPSSVKFIKDSRTEEEISNSLLKGLKKYKVEKLDKANLDILDKSGEIYRIFILPEYILLDFKICDDSGNLYDIETLATISLIDLSTTITNLDKNKYRKWNIGLPDMGFVSKLVKDIKDILSPSSVKFIKKLSEDIGMARNLLNLFNNFKIFQKVGKARISYFESEDSFVKNYISLFYDQLKKKGYAVKKEGEVRLRIDDKDEENEDLSYLQIDNSLDDWNIPVINILISHTEVCTLDFKGGILYAHEYYNDKKQFIKDLQEIIKTPSSVKFIKDGVDSSVLDKIFKALKEKEYEVSFVKMPGPPIPGLFDDYLHFPKEGKGIDIIHNSPEKQLEIFEYDEENIPICTIDINTGKIRAVYQNPDKYKKIIKDIQEVLIPVSVKFIKDIGKKGRTLTIKDLIQKVSQKLNDPSSIKMIHKFWKEDETKYRKLSNDEIYDLTGKTYFKSIPLKEIKEILVKYGFETEPLDGIYTGREGKIHEQVGPKTWLSLSWYKMPESGNYEINAYLS